MEESTVAPLVESDNGAEQERQFTPEGFRDHLLKKLRVLEPERMHNQHVGLVEIIAQLFALIQVFQRRRPTEDETRALFKLLDRFKRYATTHFRDEEAFMESVGFPGLEEQRRAHQAFVSKVLEVENRVREESVTFVVDLFFMVIHWLFDHINQLDRQYDQFVRGQEEE